MWSSSLTEQVLWLSLATQLSMSLDFHLLLLPALFYRLPLMRTTRHDTPSVLSFWFLNHTLGFLLTHFFFWHFSSELTVLRAVPFAASGVQQLVHADLWCTPNHSQSNSTSGWHLVDICRGCSGVIRLLKHWTGLGNWQDIRWSSHSAWAHSNMICMICMVCMVCMICMICMLCLTQGSLSMAQNICLWNVWDIKTWGTATYLSVVAMCQSHHLVAVQDSHKAWVLISGWKLVSKTLFADE